MAAFEKCEDLACHSIQELMREAFKKKSQSTTASEKKDDLVVKPVIPKDCPLDRESLGQSVWAMLHTVSAYYPQNPSDTDKQQARNLISSLGHLYPCVHCAESFREEIIECPPRVNSREEFSIWLCEQHNKVNERLDKPRFPCTFPALDLRWRVGREDCWKFSVDEGLKPSETLGHPEDIDID